VYERIILSGQEQTSSPNKPQTLFMSGKYVNVFIWPLNKTIRYCCRKCQWNISKGIYNGLLAKCQLKPPQDLRTGTTWVWKRMPFAPTYSVLKVDLRKSCLQLTDAVIIKSGLTHYRNIWGINGYFSISGLT
jgi:hypothetical protein